MAVWTFVCFVMCWTFCLLCFEIAIRKCPTFSIVLNTQQVQPIINQQSTLLSLFFLFSFLAALPLALFLVSSLPFLLSLSLSLSFSVGIWKLLKKKKKPNLWKKILKKTMKFYFSKLLIFQKRKNDDNCRCFLFFFEQRTQALSTDGSFWSSCKLWYLYIKHFFLFAKLLRIAYFSFFLSLSLFIPSY